MTDEPPVCAALDTISAAVCGSLVDDCQDDPAATVPARVVRMLVGDAVGVSPALLSRLVEVDSLAVERVTACKGALFVEVSDDPTREFLRALVTLDSRRTVRREWQADGRYLLHAVSDGGGGDDDEAFDLPTGGKSTCGEE